MSAISFYRLTQQQYDRLDNPDSGSVYLTADTKRLYVGTQNYTHGISGQGHVTGGYAAKVTAHTVNADGALLTLAKAGDDDLDMTKFAAGQTVFFNVDDAGEDDIFYQKHNIVSVDAANSRIQIDGSLLTGTQTKIDSEKTFCMVADSARMDNATASGDKNFVTGQRAHANGSWNTVTAMCSSADGISNIVTGEGASASGIANTVSGRVAHADGIGCTASGLAAHADGSSCTASGDNARSGGIGCTASGDTAHASGAQCKALGRGSFAAGTMAESDGENAAAAGYQVKSHAKRGMVIGSYGELADKPENQDAIAIAGGEHKALNLPFVFRSRKAVMNPAYNSALDTGNTGTDSAGEKQYIPKRAYSFTYQGRIIPETRVFSAGEQPVLDHDFFARWDARQIADLTPELLNWNDGDSGEVVFSGSLHLPESWIPSGSMTNTHPVNVLVVENVAGTVFCKLKY